MADFIVAMLVPFSFGALYVFCMIYIARLKSDKAEMNKIQHDNHPLFFQF